MSSFRLRWTWVSETGPGTISARRVYFEVTARWLWTVPWKHRRFSVLDHESTTNWLGAAGPYFCDHYSRLADGTTARLYLTLGLKAVLSA